MALASGLLLLQPPAARASCTISVATGVAFGPYNVFSSTPLDSTGQVSYQCTRGTTPAVSITLTRGSSATYLPRTLLDGAQVLDYNLYLDAARTTVWGDGSTGTQAYFGTYPGTGRVAVSLYGQVFAGQDAAVGSYTDTVTVVINF